jgi:FMN phosphatase YigB (HAD superfamily)
MVNVTESKPAPDVFEVVLKKLIAQGADAVAIGDTPYDAEAAAKAAIATVGVFCGGLPERSLKKSWMRRDFSRTSCAVRPLSRFPTGKDILISRRVNSPNHSQSHRLLCWPHPAGDARVDAICQ